MTIAVICALEREINELFKHIESPRRERCGAADVLCGKLGAHDIALALSGIGKVSAAAATQSVLSAFSVDAAFNIGLAGGCDASLAIGDAVVANKLVYHDFDLSVAGRFDEIQDGVVPDERLRSLAAQSCARAGVRYIEGTVATGDIFVEDAAVKSGIVARTGCSCVEMEGAAFAQVCYQNGVPFASAKIISDSASEGADDDFWDTLERYCERSMHIVLNLFGLL